MTKQLRLVEDPEDQPGERRQKGRSGYIRMAEALTGTGDPEPRMVPCRNCGVEIQLSGAGVGFAAKVNQILDMLGEEPFGNADLIFCPDCNAEHLRKQDAGLAEIHDKAMELLRVWRDSGEPLSAAGYQWLIQHGYKDAAEACAAADRKKAESL